MFIPFAKWRSLHFFPIEIYKYIQLFLFSIDVDCEGAPHCNRMKKFSSGSSCRFLFHRKSARLMFANNRKTQRNADNNENH